MAHIKTYARLKPSKNAYPGYEVDHNTLKIHTSDNKEFIVIDPQQVANRGNQSYEVSFTEIFRPESTQEDVFNVAAKDIIQNFLNGYNGTIFAYGQTGTGKTYTVEGNMHQFGSRGLSTRALGMIYQQLARRSDDHISVYLSYLEIYQEVAYDLLNSTARTPVPILPFSKVSACEGPQESSMLKGLTLHLAASEEIAQMLLLQGQANRKISETPANQRSSRSHAVFTVYLQARKRDSKVTLKSKLHLVDLAGSERVSKTGADGQQLTEAKSINLSLHHLETVIIALQSDHVLITNGISGDDKSMEDNLLMQSRSILSVTSGPSSDGGRPSRFVPYRNSLLTMLLKDSLGGNCLTAMIATISMEPENVGESVSTCRFAQRVAQVANNARRNEEIDDKALISRLRQKITCMKHELTSVKPKGRWRTLMNNYNDHSIVLSQDDKTECGKIMEAFLQGDITDPVTAGICDRYRFLECLHLLKAQCLQSQAALTQLLTTQHQKNNSPVMFSEARPGCSPCYNGDQRTSEVSQPGTSYFSGYQRPPGFSNSEVSMDVSEEFFSASDNHTACMANTVAECFSLEMKDGESHLSPGAHSEEKYMFPSMRMKSKAVKNTGQTASTREQEQQPLWQLKHDVLLRRVLETENSFRLKLKILEQQLLDHQAYVQWLKNNQADPVHIAKELLVERNQQKCQSRFKDKLNKLLEKKARLMRCVSFSKQKSPFIRQCCKNASQSDRSSPNRVKCKTPFSKQVTNSRNFVETVKNSIISPDTTMETPRMDNGKSALRMKDLTFKVAASLNRCGEFQRSRHTSPQPAHLHLEQNRRAFQHADEDLQETPTIFNQQLQQKTPTIFNQQLQQKTPTMSNQHNDQEPQQYPVISRQHSGQELQQKTAKISTQHADKEQENNPAICRQHSGQELLQKTSKISNQLASQDQQKCSTVSRQHSGQELLQKISKISNQHAYKEQQKYSALSKQHAGPELQQKTAKISNKLAGKEQQKSPRIANQQYTDPQQQKSPRIANQQHTDPQQQKSPRISKLAEHGSLQQQQQPPMTSKIPRQHVNQELQQKTPSKQHGYREPAHNPRTSQYTTHEQQQKTPGTAAKQHADQTLQQKTQRTRKQPAYQESQGAQENDQQESSNQFQEIIVDSKPQPDHKSILSFVLNSSDRSVSKEETSSEGSQSTEKQVKAIEDYMVVDDIEKD